MTTARKIEDAFIIYLNHSGLKKIDPKDVIMLV